MERQRAGSGFRVVAALVVAFVRAMGWRVEVRGAEHIPSSGGAVVAFNHHSYADFFMCAWGIWRDRGRPVRFLAKQELFDRPVLGWVLRRAGQIPVARGSHAGRSGALAAAVRALAAGEIVAVAPEQTISQSFELLPFTRGAARMACDAGVPIVPSVNWGTQRWATKGRRINWRARGIPVVVHYGEPIAVGADDDLANVTDRAQKVMAAMLDEVQRAYPDGPAPGDDWWVPRRLGGSAPAHDEVLRAHRGRQAAWRKQAEGPRKA